MTGIQEKESHFRHVPVLLEEVIQYAPEGCRAVLDCTLGGAGHSIGLLDRFPDTKLYAIDRDQMAIRASTEKLRKYGERVEIQHSSFSELESWLMLWNQEFDYILADVGVSSEQLARPERGFSFLEEGPLDMRMDAERQTLTARELLAQSNERELHKILKTWGEEPWVAKIAKALTLEKNKNNLPKTTIQLADLVSRTIPRRFHKNGFHPATRTFQALRIAVNHELQELELLLASLSKNMLKGSRLAVISFHSLEDRLVKQTFRNWSHPCQCPSDLPYCICGLKPLGKVLTKRPCIAVKDEIENNPRSRSARLRVFEFARKTGD